LKPLPNTILILAGFHYENRTENWPMTMGFGPTLVETWNRCPKTNVKRRNWCPKLASKPLPKTPLRFSSSNKFLMKLKNKQIAKPKTAPLLRKNSRFIYWKSGLFPTWAPGWKSYFQKKSLIPHGKRDFNWCFSVP
jgi:hypothetical protein